MPCIMLSNEKNSCGRATMGIIHDNSLVHIMYFSDLQFCFTEDKYKKKIREYTVWVFNKDTKVTDVMKDPCKYAFKLLSFKCDSAGVKTTDFNVTFQEHDHPRKRNQSIIDTPCITMELETLKRMLGGHLILDEDGAPLLRL